MSVAVDDTDEFLTDSAFLDQQGALESVDAAGDEERQRLVEAVVR